MPNVHLPRISIVTPVFNRVDMVEQTILSVLEQNYPDLEYIVIDGGSTDGTVDIIRKYADKLTYWVSEPDKGMYDAIMKGVAHATGEVMAWIGSDDMYHQGALHIVGQIFSQCREVQWLTGTPTMYNAGGLCVKTFLTQYWSWKRFQKGDFRWLQQESTFWKRSLWDTVGGLNLKYKLAADFDLWCKMFQVADLYSVNTVLGGFRLHGEQLSIGQTGKYEEEVRNICACYGLLYKLFPLHHYIKYVLHYQKYNMVEYDFNTNQWITRIK